MSTVDEIEAAIAQLPHEEFERLAAWLADKRRQGVDRASDDADW